MKNLCDMAAKKETKLEEVRAILDRAEAAGRSLTAEETARYNSGMREVKKLAEEYEAERDQQAEEMKHTIAIDGEPRGEFRSYGAENIKELRSGYGQIGHGGQTFDGWLKQVVTGKGEGRQEPTTVSGHGEYLVPMPLFGEFIANAFSRTQVLSAGARVISLDSSTLRVPRITGLPTAEFLDELAPATRSELSIDGVTAVPKKLSTQVALSVELWEDSPLMSQEVGNLLAQALAIELDRAALMGAASGPEGIINTAGIHEVDAAGPLWGYWPFSYAHGLISEACYVPSALIAHPNVFASIDILTDLMGQPLTPPNSWRTYKQLPSCNLDCECGYEETGHCAVMGQFNRLLWCVRTPAKVEVSRCTPGVGDEASAWRSYRQEVRCYLRADAVVVDPRAFAVIRGIEALDYTTPPAQPGWPNNNG